MHRNPFVNRYGLDVGVYEAAYAHLLTVLRSSHDFTFAAEMTYSSFELHGDEWKKAFGWDLSQRKKEKEARVGRVVQPKPADPAELEQRVADRTEAILANPNRKDGSFFFTVNIALRECGVHLTSQTEREQWWSRIGTILAARKNARVRSIEAELPTTPLFRR